jgi:membrane-bound inhibitor of C-type lysozyme
MLHGYLLRTAALGAALTLSACNQEPDAAGADAEANARNIAAPVVMPPAIASSYTYRCKDNSLVQIDFMTDDKTAMLRAPKDGPTITLSAPEAGKPYVSGEHVVTGKGKEIIVTLPGKSSQSCRA